MIQNKNDIKFISQLSQLEDFISEIKLNLKKSQNSLELMAEIVDAPNKQEEIINISNQLLPIAFALEKLEDKIINTKLKWFRNMQKYLKNTHKGIL